jgi:hypothetical protein
MAQIKKGLLFLIIFLLPTQLGYHFWPSWSLLHGLRIDFLSPVLYLTDILIIIYILLPARLNASLRAFGGSFRFYLPACLRLRRGLPAPWCGVVILSFAFCVLNLTQSLSFPLTLVFLLRLTVYYFFIKTLVRDSNFNLNFISLPISLISSITLVLMIFQLTLQRSLNGLFYWFGERFFNLLTPRLAHLTVFSHLLIRPPAIFSHPNALAGFFLVVFFLSRSKILKIISFIIIVFSFSKAALFAFIIINLYRLIKHKRIMPQLFIPLFLLLSLVFIKSNFSSITSRLVPLPSLRLLTGSGLGAHLLLLPPIPFPEPIHNIFLILFLETGLLSLILMFCFLKYYLQNLSAPGGSLSVPAWSAVLLTGLLDHYWLTSHQNQLLVCLLIAFTVKQSIHRQIR